MRVLETSLATPVISKLSDCGPSSVKLLASGSRGNNDCPGGTSVKNNCSDKVSTMLD